MPKVSIIIPVYNVEDYLKRCVDSLLSQTLQEIEIILVDDGSTDQSGQICEAYARQDKRVRVLHKSNGGLSDARNHGMAIATGDYLGFVDSDDYVEVDMYETLYKICQQYQADIASCDFYSVAEQEKTDIPDYTGKVTLLTPTELFKSMIDINSKIRINVWNKLYKREIFENVEFPVGKLYEDVATMHQVVFKAKRAVSIDLPKYYYITKRLGAISHRWYDERQYERYEMHEAMVSYLREHQPQLLLDGIGYKAVNCHLGIVRLMIRSRAYDGAMIRFLKKDIRADYPRIWSSPLPWTAKLRVTLFVLSFPLYRLCYINLRKSNMYS